ncbi:MAG: flagellar basal-body MS-ring/collar protein FliF [Myxococcota bacterium]|nr:flagellar basal-body MS-ring/collar protein FliF [Myxococcota bacterium]
MQKLIDQLKAIWADLSPQRRMFAVGGLITIVGTVAILVAVNSGENYTKLLKPAKDQNVEAITDALEARTIPSRMGEDGWITVPAAHLDEARLIASMAHGKVEGVGLEMFDQPTFGASQFDKYVNYIRGLEGELGRTIARIDGVRSARVHLTIPKRRPIRSLQKPPKASVNVRLMENMMIPRDRVRSIQLMAASAVEGMDPDKVSVTDQHGNNLSAPESASKSDDRALKLKHKYEESVTERVLNMLEPVVGVGKVRVNVTADMDFASVQETRTDIDPDKQTVKSESTSEETSTSDQTGAGGVVGQAANDPQRNPDGLGGAKTNSLKKSEQRVFENATTITKRAEGGARIKQLSVGVIIDGYMGENAEGQSSWTAWTPDEMKKFEDALKSGTGIVEGRGDQLSIENIQFRDVPVIQEVEEPMLSPFVQQIIEWGIMLLIAIMVIFGVLRPLMKNLIPAITPTTALAVAGGGTMAGSAPAAANSGMRAEDISAGALPFPGQPQSDVVRVGERLRLQAIESTKQNPERAVEVIRAWLLTEDPQ